MNYENYSNIFNLWLKRSRDMDLDFRVVVVLLPVILAGSWAVFNIARAALAQIQGFLTK